MIPGISGRLLSHSYMEQRVASTSATPDTDRFARDLNRWWRRAEDAIGPASSVRAVMDVAALPLFNLLGLTAASTAPHRWGHAGTLRSAAGGDPTLFIAIGWGVDPLIVWRDAVRASLTSGARWALICSGCRLVVLDARRAWSPRFLDFDLDVVRRNRAAIGVLYATTAESALGAPGGRGSLENAAAESDRLGVDVCRQLGGGVLKAIGALAATLDRAARARREPARTFDEALTLVYRLLFLLFAEARGLVPVWNEVYREAYTIDALCRRLDDRPDAPGVWATVQAISRLAHQGYRAGDLDVTAFNGRLFSPSHAPIAERRRLPDDTMRQAVLALATARSSDGVRRIGYHDLGVEQLGSVYERVLEYEPARRQGTLTLERTSLARKNTGSYYTPRPMTDFLVRRTLAPLVANRRADQILQLRVLDPAMGSGAFLVSACRYLAAACEQARIDEGDWTAQDVTDADRAGLRRLVAERCLFGVDLNPTAVQLARLSLWLTTLAANRPLTFLDHHLVTGDSLIGMGLADLARPFRLRRAARAADLPLFEDEASGVLARDVLPARWRLALDASDSVELVRQKERVLRTLEGATSPLRRWQTAADLRCAVLLDPELSGSKGVYDELHGRAIGGVTALKPHWLDPVLARATTLARARGCLHWELTFPEVFFDERGQPRADAGFDAVIGNPPWDMVRADSGDRRARAGSRSSLEGMLHFVRASGQYALQGSGQPNFYQLFTERALQLLRPGGRVGLVLPSGLQTDVGSAGLRRALLDGCSIDTWLGFENRDAVFPIHRSVRFVLLAATRGSTTERLTYRCGLRRPSTLDERPDSSRDDGANHHVVTLDRALLDRWDPEALSIPEARSPIDIAIVATALDHAPSLSSETGWGVRFGRELNATDDRGYFVNHEGSARVDFAQGRRRSGALRLRSGQALGLRSRQALRPRSMEADGRHEGSAWLPVIEGKHLEPFRVRAETARHAIAESVASALLDPDATYRRPRVAYRDVAGAGNRLTLIAGVLPAGVVSTHTVFCAKTSQREAERWCLLALLNSLTANYLVRLQVSTHVTTALMARLRVPKPAADSKEWRELADRAAALSECGIETDVDSYARINAIAARLYGLTTVQYQHVVESFPLLPESIRTRCVEVHGRGK